MKAKEVHGMRDDELALEIKNLRGKLFDLRSQLVTEKVEDTSQFRKIRQDIARMLTEASARRHKAGRDSTSGQKPGTDKADADKAPKAGKPAASGKKSGGGAPKAKGPAKPRAAKKAGADEGESKPAKTTRKKTTTK